MKIRAITLFVLSGMIAACTSVTTSPNVTATQPAAQASAPQPSQTAISMPVPTPIPILTLATTLPSPTQTPSMPSSQMSIISAGDSHTCALTDSGGVKCWGANDYGALGDGTTIHSSTPVDVVGLSSGVISVAAGGNQTCALTAAGGVKCWGLNESGELGDGTETNSSTPVDVVGLSSGVAAISVGGSRACAVTAAGGVKCWGFLWYGQWEQGKKNFNSTPVDVPNLGSGVVAVSNGYNHICVLTSEGGVKCWGFNASGQLGSGSTEEGSSIWVHVVGLGSQVAAIATGSNHTCALTISGGVKCWGDNTWGQVGDGTAENRSTPVDVLGLRSGVVAIAAGSGNTCALMASGGVKCWGHGYLGNGTTENSSTPVSVTGLDSAVVALTVGSGHICALTNSGKMKCWGENEFGQLGDGVPPLCVKPVDVTGLGNGVLAISVGSSDACALDAAGMVKCWGPNYLPKGTTSERSTPVDMASLGSEVKTLGIGGVFFHCALTALGNVECWGKDKTPVEVTSMEGKVKAISAGLFHLCAVTVSGGVKCWGEPQYAGLGDGTTNPSTTPVDVAGLASGVSAVAVGFSHTCALTTAGGVKCWGWNGFGQLGDGTEIDRLSPVDVSGLGGTVVAIAAGSYHTCALTDLGGVKCWGQNEEGQLGDGTDSLKPALTPVDVVGLSSGVIAITAGEHHTCALVATGGVKCWGDNLYGQLGDGTLIDRATPADVVNLGSGVAAIDAGFHYNCALTAAGGVKCWGNDSIGQMGDGRILWSSVPVDVTGWGTNLTP